MPASRPSPDIVSWLSQVAEPSPSPPRRAPKPFGRATLPSPPLSCSTPPKMSARDADDGTGPRTVTTPVAKRRKLTSQSGDTMQTGKLDPSALTAVTNPTEDLEATPRPILAPSYHSQSSERSTTSSSASRRSGRSSPSRRLRRLALDDDGIETRPFDRADPTIPEPLLAMWDEMTDIGEGVRVLAGARRAEIEASVPPRTPGARARLRPPRDDNYARPGEEADARDALGPTPSVQQALAIVGRATTCARRNAEEAAWNSAVHFPLLQIAIHGGQQQQQQQQQGGLVDITQRTSATIIPEYLSVGASGKKVDFVLHIDPGAAGAAATAARIDDRRKALPKLSINHTDHDALLREPVVVSIETKRPSADRAGPEARLQIGTWHAAQWNNLAALTRLGTSTETVPGEDRAHPRVPHDVSDSPPFLPAIIVHGHDWAFAATTRVGSKTILWTECPFGSTRDVLGVYKIVCGVQRLAALARNVYWPWYQQYALKIDA